MDRLFQRAGLPTVETLPTKAGWCLRQGLTAVYQADGGSLAAVMDHHGVPGFYLKTIGCRHAATDDIKAPSTCFQSLSRIIAGQFVSGSSAQAAWRKLLSVVDGDLTPRRILDLVKDGDIEKGLQKPAGLTKAKAASIVDLAQRFQANELSEDFLTSNVDEETLRKALLAVKGIGPWSCDIFLMFYLERPNILPLGDLGVRKGIAMHYRMRGSAAKGSLCLKRDAERVRQRLQVYEPYQSLVTYYMWRVADTPLPQETASQAKAKRAIDTVSSSEATTVDAPLSAPITPAKRKRLVRKVTP